MDEQNGCFDCIFFSKRTTHWPEEKTEPAGISNTNEGTWTHKLRKGLEIQNKNSFCPTMPQSTVISCFIVNSVFLSNFRVHQESRVNVVFQSESTKSITLVRRKTNLSGNWNCAGMCSQGLAHICSVSSRYQNPFLFKQFPSFLVFQDTQTLDSVVLIHAYVCAIFLTLSIS